MANSRELCYLDRGIERNVALPSCKDSEAAGESVAVASASSPAVREYEDKLKAIELQKRGVEKAAIALRLGRSERWVQRWWKQEPRLIQRPHGAQDTVFQKVPLAGFRDLEITRGFAQEPSLFQTLVRDVPWRRGKVMTRDQITGELVLRFDRHGQTIPASRLVADCPRGVPELDALLQRTFTKANIRDPQARVVLNLYTDGGQQLNSHRHDFWTCLISLGAPRVLLVDNRPQVMEDGDMIVFGTQMHGVPPMPTVSQGRISLVIFFYPDRDNLERRWLTIGTAGAEQDDEECAQLSGAAVAFCDDCRTGSASTTSVPGTSAFAALNSVLDPSAARTRPHWRKSNAELQFMEYPKIQGVNLYSAGCGDLSAVDLLAGLTRHGVAILWDLRSGREGGLAIGREQMRETCRGRVQYREWQIGTAAAGGLAPHLFRTEEGTTMIYRLLSEGKQSTVCFLGFEGDWRKDDLRMSVGFAAAAAGAHVVHLNLLARAEFSLYGIDNECESHPRDFELPTSLQPRSRVNNSSIDMSLGGQGTVDISMLDHAGDTTRDASLMSPVSSNRIEPSSGSSDLIETASGNQACPNLDVGTQLDQASNGLASLSSTGTYDALGDDYQYGQAVMESRPALPVRYRRWERCAKSAKAGAVQPQIGAAPDSGGAEERRARGRWNASSRSRELYLHQDIAVCS